MTNSQIPSYSGVTINIANPSVSTCPQPGIAPQVNVSNPIQQQAPQPQQAVQTQQTQVPQAYPPEYYVNNYNIPAAPQQTVQAPSQPKVQVQQSSQPAAPIAQTDTATEDLTSSQKIIDSLDAKAAEQKELEKNGKQTKIVSLTDEYIMSLENYLNNQNTDVRVMAAKEILTRLDEDKSRYDDPALNALLNKMLQDPQKLVRVAALSALSSGLASGNDYTVQLLNNIQQNPNSDKEDVVEAANILLKMSGGSEIKYTPKKEDNKQQ